MIGATSSEWDISSLHQPLNIYVAIGLDKL